MFSIFFCLYARAVKRKSKGYCGAKMFVRLPTVQLHWQTTDVFCNVPRIYWCTTFPA